MNCCRENEKLSMQRIANTSETFESFKSLATLSAFQIDIAHISKTPDNRWRTVILNRPYCEKKNNRPFGDEENVLTKVYRSMLRKSQITPDGLISGVSKLSAFLVWMVVIISIGFGVYAGTRVTAWEERIDSVVKVSGPVFLILVIAEYLSPHEHYVKVLLTSNIEIKKMSQLARSLASPTMRLCGWLLPTLASREFCTTMRLASFEMARLARLCWMGYRGRGRRSAIQVCGAKSSSWTNSGRGNW